MPRPYSLGQRAAPKAETRDRIVAAALAIYLDRGMAAASNLAIARAADVAPATVRNHFPEPGDLAPRRLLGAARRAPDPDAGDLRGPRATFEIASNGSPRELAAFYERSEPWWRAYQREPELINAWSGGIDGVLRGHRSADARRARRAGSDERSVAVVATVIGPPTYFGLRARGLESDDAVRLTLELTLPWLERRRDALAGRP